MADEWKPEERVRRFFVRPSRQFTDSLYARSLAFADEVSRCSTYEDAEKAKRRFYAEIAGAVKATMDVYDSIAANMQDICAEAVAVMPPRPIFIPK